MHDLLLILINHLPHFISDSTDELFDLSLELGYDLAVICIFRDIVDRGKDLGDGLESFHIILLSNDSLLKAKFIVNRLELNGNA